MPLDYRRALCYLDELLDNRTLGELGRRLDSSSGSLAQNVPGKCRVGQSTVARRWEMLNVAPEIRAVLTNSESLEQAACYRRNIENFIGTIKLPLGLAGPLRINGLFAHGDYYVPLATTEATLVASYSRGAQLISEAGGCSAMLISEGVSRAPGFVFANLREAGLFIAWAASHFDEFKREAEATTRYGKLIDMKIEIEGNHVYLIFEFTTGDASGQNMVTIATEAICSYIRDRAPVKPRYAFLEANLSGDKKATAQSFLSVRGKKVTAESTLPASLVEKYLHASPGKIADYWRLSAIGTVLSGAIGAQGHYANGLAALYIACGQDVACVAESAIGVTRFELTPAGDLYASVTLPNLIVGTVGGGTALPSQHACLEIMGLAGPGKAKALAEVCAALCLAGELSITGALCADDFARAHRCLARASAAASAHTRSLHCVAAGDGARNEGSSNL